jgi:hypothetical protein
VRAFTKDELEEIYYMVECAETDYVGKENNELLNKIEAMIQERNKPDYNSQRGISVPVDTNPTRE